MSVKLSFCIPCYNFADFLPETLDSIIAQATEAVEIVIVDGGSTDATDDIVADYQRRFARITYFKRESRCGVDLDILKSVELARGEYCWLFSADDVLSPGAVARVLGMIDDRWNVLLTNFSVCDYYMNRIGPHLIINHHDGPRTYDWSDPAGRAAYLDAAMTSTALFSFISSIVVRRADWLAADGCEGFVGSCWIIAAKIGSMSHRRLVVRYIPDEMFKKRGDNDSFMSMGAARRLRLALEGFPAIAEKTFGAGTPEHEAFRRVARNEIPYGSLLNLKIATTGDPSARRELNHTARECWARTPRERAQLVAMRLAPVSLLVLAKRIAKRSPRVHRWLKRISRAGE